MDKLQWGNKKRLRCMKVKESSSNGMKRKITSRVDNNKESVTPPHRSNRDVGTARSGASEFRKGMTSSSPEKEDRYYTTRGSVGLEDHSKLLPNPKVEKKKFVWPKLLITLSSKEKEEDFMAMRGTKLPQRPKKRAKLIQRTILLVSPGTWLSDLCQERYEVREKKTSKKKPRGLKAMGSMESDSE
ncbi:unnamed protein product [Cuscuta campestris]|uniref:DUF1639 domain-containing protein n=2 Tax=Cuscuta sect. Cleistogrammica TaxID=1824901 RepID=A0A484KD36_9ASTE|nr:hypothetical protein DM860_009833 [Cuscuta australis]VFQ60032.1 unnamed protein product [Cuscuta campestris]VFQ93380.1 unnamed protein product [Cuscuta campestris]